MWNLPIGVMDNTWGNSQYLRGPIEAMDKDWKTAGIRRLVVAL